ncbi:MAG: DUF4293 domain-containing protein [Saprospiraceae bacterium]
MIQRIQSLWLVLSSILFGLEYLKTIPFAMTTNPGLAPLDDKILLTEESPILLFGCLASCVLAVIAIFLYKNRSTQILLSGLAGLIQTSCYLGFGFYIIYQSGLFSAFKADLGVYFGLFGLLANWLATKAIRKDSELVKSMDRLR